MMSGDTKADHRLRVAVTIAIVLGTVALGIAAFAGG
jgi:hypothetical protein